MLELDLTGKIALITGATGQLGRVMAHTLADCGADIVCIITPTGCRRTSWWRS